MDIGCVLQVKFSLTFANSKLDNSASRFSSILPKFTLFLSKVCINNRIKMINHSQFGNQTNHSQFINQTLISWYNIRLSISINIFSFIGIVLNSILCVTIFNKRNLQQPHSRLMANLALSDMIFCILLSVKATLPVIFNNQRYSNTSISINTGTLVCKTVSFFEMLTVGSSMLTLAAIGIERYRAIIYPLNGSLSKYHLKIFLPATWAFSAIAAAFYVIDRNYYYNILDCTGAFTSSGNSRKAVFTAVFASIVVFTPLLIILICYACIAVKLCRKTLPMDESDYKIQAARIEQKKTVCIVTLMCMTVISAMTFCPFIIFYLWISFSKISDPNFFKGQNYLYWKLLQAFTIILLIPCILNPLLYNIASSNFRKEIKQLLKSLRWRMCHRSIAPKTRNPIC